MAEPTSFSDLEIPGSLTAISCLTETIVETFEVGFERLMNSKSRLSVKPDFNLVNTSSRGFEASFDKSDNLVSSLISASDLCGTTGFGGSKTDFCCAAGTNAYAVEFNCAVTLNGLSSIMVGAGGLVVKVGA